MNGTLSQPNKPMSHFFFQRKSLVWQSMPLDSYGWPSWASTWPNCGQPVDQSLGDWSHTLMEASGIHGLMPGSLAHLAATQLAQTMGPNPTWAVLATALDGQKVQNWLPMELLGQVGHGLALALLGNLVLVLLLGLVLGHLHGLHGSHLGHWCLHGSNLGHWGLHGSNLGHCFWWTSLWSGEWVKMAAAKNRIHLDLP